MIAVYRIVFNPIEERKENRGSLATERPRKRKRNIVRDIDGGNINDSGVKNNFSIQEKK